MELLPIDHTNQQERIMKKFINRPENAIEEMLEGLLVLNPDLARLSGQKVLLRADAEKIRNHQVAIISGGGSGHEPAHAGYIGAGMLSAAVAGEVFTSPDSDSVYAAIKAVAGPPGALLVVKNYTGDRLNFGFAAEMARSERIPVTVMLVDDDVALAEEGQVTGARGLAGTILIHKIVGAAAAEGTGLNEVADIGRASVASLATMGVSLSAGVSPAVGKPSFELGDDEMELGLGIHGEPGVMRTQLKPSDEVVETLVAAILKQRRFGNDKRVVAMVNNLGATTPMELAIVARRLTALLKQQSFRLERVYAGTFLSSLDMAGISISLLGVDDERLRLLDAPTAASAWPNVPRCRPDTIEAQAASTAPAGFAYNTGGPAQTEGGKAIKTAIEAACAALIAAEPQLTEMDRIVGDGDLGASMKRAALAIRAAVDSYPLDDVPATLKALGRTLQRELGGSSGPLYGVLFLRCGSVLENRGNWIEATQAACLAITELGGAVPGDRTMLDALAPFATTLKNAGSNLSGETFRAAAKEAQRGAEATAGMKPRRGRSSYLGDRVLGHPDPGATAVAIWLTAISEALFPKK